MNDSPNPGEVRTAGMPAEDFANLRRLSRLCDEVSQSPYFSWHVRAFYRSAKLNCDLLLSGDHTVQDATTSAAVLGDTE